jgi:type III pantothenate kinase
LKPHINKLSVVKKIPSTPLKTVTAYRKIFKAFIGDHSERGFLKDSEQKAVMISSVVPVITPLIVKALQDLGMEKPLFVSHKATGGLTLNLRRKKTIGADRISNAAAGYFLFNRAAAVVDCGTATTLTVVGKNADILGGAIMPGIGLMQKALFKGTAKLPDIAVKTPKRVLGRDTESAITTGIIHGTAGAVENIIQGIQSEIAYELKIILTGGFAKILSPVLKLNHILRPNLIFDGMRIIYLKTKGLKTY